MMRSPHLSTNKHQQNWWYTTHEHHPKGPVSTTDLISLFSSGLVDGLTTVSEDSSIPQSDWIPLSEHPELSETLRNHNQSLHHSDEESQPHPHPDPDLSPNALPQLPNPNTAEQRERKRLSRKRARKAAKLRNLQNTSIYVTGIPPGTTESQLSAHFLKCGIILPNPETGTPRVKLYRNTDGSLKGDALITYAFRPSIDNAISLLDGVPLRDGTPPLTVREATFDHKPSDRDQDDEQGRKKQRLPIRARDLVEEALSWSDEYQVQKGAPRIVILKNVFDPASAEYDIIKEDMKEGCEACGDVDKITVFERNEEGAVAVKFATVEASLKCINVMNGRWYDGRKLHAAFYDGQTNYAHKETDEERKQREQKWEDWIGGDQSAPTIETNATPPPDKDSHKGDM